MEIAVSQGNLRRNPRLPEKDMMSFHRSSPYGSREKFFNAAWVPEIVVCLVKSSLNSVGLGNKYILMGTLWRESHKL